MPNYNLEKPTCCPICQTEWRQVKYYSSTFWKMYDCINVALCKTAFYQSVFQQDEFIIHKSLSKNYYPYINWDSRMGCYYNLGNPNEGNVKLNFIVPYNITEERLKLLILMS